MSTNTKEYSGPGQPIEDKRNSPNKQDREQWGRLPGIRSDQSHRPPMYGPESRVRGTPAPEGPRRGR